MAGVRVVDQRARAANAVRAGIGVVQLQITAVQPPGRGQRDAGHIGVFRYAGQSGQQAAGKLHSPICVALCGTVRCLMRKFDKK